MGGVSVAVAQAMRYAGCPNRRSLGVSDVFPLSSGEKNAPLALFFVPLRPSALHLPVNKKSESRKLREWPERE